MFSTTAMFLSSILSELTSRSISFLIDKCSRSTSPPTEEETLSNLQRLLLRVHVIVDEADERHISNQAMLRQLSQLRKEMYRGYHTLDTFRCRVSPSFTTSRSIFSPAKRIRFSSDSSSSDEQEQQLRQVLGCLEIMIRDASELVVFLSGCPRRCRQPYNMYLMLDNCMFGRQMEMERIMKFLLHEEVPIDGNTPGVLPIVGPGKVGKSTLIEHACNDERVRDHFSKIMCFRQCGTTDDRIVATLSDCDVIKHSSRAIGVERILVIIELIGDMDEDVWMKFYSDCKHHVAGGSGSRIIVASRLDKIARFGTSQPLEVKYLTPEEYWYFFKVRMFRSTDPEDHPKLTSIAMDLARETEGGFFAASLFSGLLKANFDAHFCSMALASIKNFKRVNPRFYGDKCVHSWQGFKPINVGGVNKTSSELVILHDYETGFVQDRAQNEGPQMSIRDLFFGSNNVRPHGRFEVAACRSHIPPHYSYMWECEVRRPQRMISRRKIIRQIQQS